MRFNKDVTLMKTIGNRQKLRFGLLNLEEVSSRKSKEDEYDHFITREDDDHDKG